MENTKNEKFEYTYSSRELDEIKKIRKKYAPAENKMELLKKLDASVTGKANLRAITLGVIGSLILGTGMSCAMVWKGDLFIPGIVIGIAGMGVAALAYPVYQNTIKKEREKIAPEIIRLTDELMK